MTARRFPPPWTIEELNDACFVVSDEPVACDTHSFFTAGSTLLTTRRIAANVAKLPDWAGRTRLRYDGG
jgi:hypothetical protein